MAISRNLNEYQGDDITYTLTLTVDNIPLDITGYTFYMTIKNSEDDEDAAAVVQKVVTSHLNPTGGVTEIKLTNSDTDSLNTEYFYDIQMKDDSDEITTLLYGLIDFTKQITRSKS